MTINIDKKLSLKHVLTHRHIFAVFYHVEINADEKFSLSDSFLQIPENQIHRYPVSRLTHKYLETIYEQIL